MILSGRFLLILFLACGAIAQAQTELPSISGLRLINEYVVPFNKPFRNTKVGGLSGIDYDATHNVYHMICDDRSAINPARYYSARINISASGIDSVEFTDVHFLLQADGSTYPNSKQDPRHTPDPESIRYNPVSNELIWSSEGERIVRAKDTILVNPSINFMELNGKVVRELNIPDILSMHASEMGPRKNGTLEGLSFGNAYHTIYASMEEPLYEDGARVGLKENKSPLRILEFDEASGKNTAQYAYIPEPVAYPANPETEYKINGIPEILWIGKNKILVVERSFSTGRLGCTVKIFIADLSQADNIMSVASLKVHPVAHPAAKKLLLNMDDLGRYIDNVEGVTVGPDLPNGHKTLIFMVDNNFEFIERTQFFLFEVIP